MSINEVNVTRNKKRRLDNDGTADNTAGISAAASTDVAATHNAKFKSSLGPQLEHMLVIFVLQPNELKDTLLQIQ